MTIPHPRHWQRQVKFDFLDGLPDRSGIYAVMNGRQCLYIGRSVNLHSRWTRTGSRRHHRYWLAMICGTHLKYRLTHDPVGDERVCINKYYAPWNDTAVPWFVESKKFWGLLGAWGWLLWEKRRPRRKTWLDKARDLFNGFVLLLVIALVISLVF